MTPEEKTNIELEELSENIYNIKLIKKEE